MPVHQQPPSISFPAHFADTRNLQIGLRSSQKQPRQMRPNFPFDERLTPRTDPATNRLPCWGLTTAWGGG